MYILHKGYKMAHKEIKVTANFSIDKDKWLRFKKISQYNNSDASKELRKFIDDYLSKNSQTKMDF